MDIAHVCWRMQYDTFEVFTCTADLLLFFFIDWLKNKYIVVFFLSFFRFFSFFSFFFGGCHLLLNADIFH